MRLKACDHCGEHIGLKNLVRVGDKNFCERCTKAIVVFCPECGNFETMDNIYIISEEIRVCRKCIEKYTTCEKCNKYIKKSHAHSFEGKKYCNRCIDEVSSLCGVCVTRHRAENLTHLSFENIDVCSECFSECAACHTCGEMISRREQHRRGNGRVYCRDCYSSSEPIKSYSYKPRPRFKKLDSEKNPVLFFGTELEVEDKQGRTSKTLQNAAEDITNELFYCKHDGSICHGFEIVTHPFTFSWMKENIKIFSPVFELRENGYRSYNTTTCGLHVHISKKAFNDSKLHLYKFTRLFYDFPDLTIKIAQRDREKMSSYATFNTNKENKQKLKKEIKGERSPSGRYQALNFTNRDTVEVRIFRGTLAKIGYFRAVEYCHAAVEFTKKASVAFSKEDFLNFVINNKKSYKNLHKWMTKKGVITTEDIKDTKEKVGDPVCA